MARLRWLSWRAALALLAGMALAGVALTIAVLGWNYPIDKLDPGRGGPLLLLDRQGQVLRSVPAADGRRGAWTRLADLPPLAVTAILAAEDERFFAHPGVDLRAMARALWLDLCAGRAAFGASTVTMQLVRMVEHPREPRTLRNKLEEMVLALRLERAMAKRQILEQYLNRAYFGRGAYGLDAAARTYFGKPAAGLADGEATLLAVLPRAPARYDPLRHLPRALTRRHHVLGLLRERGRLSRQDVALLESTPPQVRIRPPGFAAPHFCDWLLAELPADLLARGGVVHTTLDLGLQLQLERRIRDHVASLQTEGVGQAGAVVLDSQSGAVVALAGSVDYKVSALDIATWKRHPGSALKPFLYALALEDGANPASVALDIHDVPSDYHVRRLTQPERGPVRLRNALAGSLNLAAVHTLEQVGIAKLLARLDAAGIGPLPGTAGDYGLRLALGAARVRLLDVAAAYGFLVREGKVVAAHGVVDVELADGQRWQPAQARQKALFAPEIAWQVMDILADADARHAVFGDDLPLDLPFAVAAKTGTSRGFSDTVAIGATTQWTVGAWAGNFDGSPIHGVLAMRTAAPLVRAGLLLASQGKAQTLPPRPGTLLPVEVCALSGLLPGPDCPHRVAEPMTARQRPHTACDWHGHDADGRERVRWPRVAEPWARQHRAFALDPLAAAASPEVAR